MGVKPSASQDEINKAYRKKSRLIHPDKAKQSFVAARAKPTKQAGTKPGVRVTKSPSDREVQKAVKEASDRFARLGLIANILRGEGRERYDHFLSNGFPKWRGTGYYYARFRPGLVSTLLGLFIFGGGLAHYGALVLSRKRQREFVERYIRHARKTAWGDESGIMGIPGVESTSGVATPPTVVGEDDEMIPVNRKQRRLQERESKKGKETKRARSAKASGTSTPLETETRGPQGQKKRVQAENGKTLLVDSVGNVYLEEEGEDGKREEYLLDPNEIAQPTFQHTVLYRLPVWVYQSMRSTIIGPTKEDIDAGWVDAGDEFDTTEDEKHLRMEAAINGAAQKRKKRSAKDR